jgi:hypothetical protein
MMGRIALLALALSATPASSQSPFAEGAQPEAEAIRIMSVYARCVVDDDPRQAAALVESDRRSPDYQKNMRFFAIREKGCMPQFGRLKMQPVIFAGMMAEELMRRKHVDVSTLGGLSGLPAATSVTTCLMQTQAQQVAGLFRTAPASRDEARSLALLKTAETQCPGVQPSPATSPVMLRAQLALLGYRLAMATDAPSRD